MSNAVRRAKGRAGVSLLTAALLALSLLPMAGAAPVAAASVLCSWSSGFVNPTHMAFANGLIYVAEFGEGASDLGRVSVVTPCVTTPDPAPWTGFNHPEGIAIHGSRAYVADTWNHKIKVYDLATSAFEFEWGHYGTEPGEFAIVPGIAIDSSGNVYTADVDYDHIQKFTAGGAPLDSWGGVPDGSEPCQFTNPQKIAVDGSGNIFVADHINHRIVKIVQGVGCTVFAGVTREAGSDTAHLSQPLGVAVDGNGNVFVSDNGNNRIMMYNASGTYLDSWSMQGPFGMVLDGPFGSLYVTSWDTDSITKFSVDHPAAPSGPPTPPTPPGPDTGPVTSGVSAVLQEGGQASKAPVVVSWTSLDGAGGPPLLHQIQRRAIRGTKSGAWVNRGFVSGGQSFVDVAKWRKFQYQVRTQDEAGVWGAWALSSPIKLKKVQEGRFARSSGWTLLGQSDAMGRRLARSSSAGATATFSFVGNGVALVAPTGAGYGSLQVCLDPGQTSESCRTVDLGTFAPNGPRRLVANFGGLAQANHVLRVTVVSGSVSFDAAIITRV